MREAQSLRELLRIRQHQAAWLRRLPGYLGSAVGYKYREGSGEFARTPEGNLIPSVLVFVREKRKAHTLTAATKIPDCFEGPKNLWCQTDIVTGALPHDAPPVPPPTPANQRLLTDLNDKELGLIGGLPLTTPEMHRGTAACVVRIGNTLGFLTNWHVAGLPGAILTRQSPRLIIVGHTTISILTAPHTPKDPDDLESFTSAKHRVDVGFVQFPGKPFATVKAGVYTLGRLGQPHQLDLDTMDLIGREVVGIGQKLGAQTGLIAAYGYEWRPDPEVNAWNATDYLIVGRDNRPFAAPGDSGKLVVTADKERRPVALLWGGERQEFWAAEAQQTWSYASDIGLVLRLLGAAIYPG